MWTRGQLNIALYAVTSTALFAASLVTLLANSYDYMTLVQELTFNVHLAILLNFIVCFYLVCMLVTIRIFFGEIRAIEMEHIADRIPFSMLTLLFLLLNDENLILDWIWFGLTLCAKVYHTILYDRIDFLQIKIVNRLSETVGGPTSRWGVLRMYVGDVSVILLLFFIFGDVFMAKLLAIDLFQGLSAIESLLFGIQFGVMGIESYTYMGKLALNMYEVIFFRSSFEARLAPGAPQVGEEDSISAHADVNGNGLNELEREDVDDLSEFEDDDFEEQIWENKSFYVQLFLIFLSTLKATFYMVFLYMLSFHSSLTLPGTIIQGCITSLYQLCKQIVLFRVFLKHSQRLDNHLSTATEEELAAADHVCIICRENMHCPATFERVRKKQLNPRRYPKKLWCGHILHLACLKDWLERSDSCPLCRKKVFATTEAPVPAPALTQARPRAPAEEVVQTPAPTAAAATGATAVNPQVGPDAPAETSNVPGTSVGQVVDAFGANTQQPTVEVVRPVHSLSSVMSTLSQYSSSLDSNSSGGLHVPSDWLCLPVTRTTSPNTYSVKLSDTCVGTVRRNTRSSVYYR